MAQELLDLSDHIGTVKTGLSEETVKDLVKRRTYISTRINLEEAPSTDLETDSCTICQVKAKTTSSKLMQTLILLINISLLFTDRKPTRTEIRSQCWTASTSTIQHAWRSGWSTRTSAQSVNQRHWSWTRTRNDKGYNNLYGFCFFFFYYKRNRVKASFKAPSSVKKCT